ncbi:tetratricopeptide repeat protein [Kitasatospora sp. NPDC057015]|uniref:tetratricopeptide repeat protein n=1 Tax=Kitasatospora sp. NPDC057015 TaxID=3346001 RepID=UPI00364154C9
MTKRGTQTALAAGCLAQTGLLALAGYWALTGPRWGAALLLAALVGINRSRRFNRMVNRALAASVPLEELAGAHATVERAWRPLARVDPRLGARGRGRALHGQAALLADAGRHPEAERLLRRAVELHRLPARRGTAGRSAGRLAGSLDLLAFELAELGRPEEALAASAEAVDVLRAEPSADRGQLGGCLVNLAVRQRDTGRSDRATESAGRAVEVLRAVHGQRLHLARALQLLAELRAADHAFEEAVTAQREAVELLTGADPDDEAAERLAAALTTLGAHLGDLDRHPEAVWAHRRALAELDRPDAPARRDSPTALGAARNLAGAYLAAGRPAEAVAAFEEVRGAAERLGLPRAAAVDEAHRTALLELAPLLAGERRYAEAVDAAERAVLISEELAAADPDHRLLPADALLQLGVHLAQAGRHARAVAADHRAVALLREAAPRSAGARRRLARALNDLAVDLDALGRLDEALDAVGEAVAVYRGAAGPSPHPDEDLDTLVLLLLGQVRQLGRLGRWEEAEAPAAEAVAGATELRARAARAGRPAAEHDGLLRSARHGHAQVRNELGLDGPGSDVPGPHQQGPGEPGPDQPHPDQLHPDGVAG